MSVLSSGKLRMRPGTFVKMTRLSALSAPAIMAAARSASTLSATLHFNYFSPLFSNPGLDESIRTLKHQPAAPRRQGVNNAIPSQYI